MAHRTLLTILVVGIAFHTTWATEQGSFKHGGKDAVTDTVRGAVDSLLTSPTDNEDDDLPTKPIGIEDDDHAVSVFGVKVVGVRGAVDSLLTSPTDSEDDDHINGGTPPTKPTGIEDDDLPNKPIGIEDDDQAVSVFGVKVVGHGVKGAGVADFVAVTGATAVARGSSLVVCKGAPAGLKKGSFKVSETNGNKSNRIIRSQLVCTGPKCQTRLPVAGLEQGDYTVVLCDMPSMESSDKVGRTCTDHASFTLSKDQAAHTIDTDAPPQDTFELVGSEKRCRGKDHEIRLVHGESSTANLMYLVFNNKNNVMGYARSHSTKANTVDSIQLAGLEAGSYKIKWCSVKLECSEEKSFTVEDCSESPVASDDSEESSTPLVDDATFGVALA